MRQTAISVRVRWITLATEGAIEMKYGNKNRKAFTLAEAMIAMVILAVATSAVILPFSTAGALTQEGAKRTLAASLAADLLEEIQNAFVTMDPFWFSVFYDGVPQSAGMVTDANGQVFTDPVYSKFARLSTCSDASVGGESLIWTTVYIYYNDIEIFQAGTLIGP